MENPRIDHVVKATQLEEWLIEDTDEPFRLSNAAIEGDLDLSFTRIRRTIAITECEFGGKLDLRNAHFQATFSLTKCHFKKQFNSGDREFSHTMYDEDMILSESTFDEQVHFIGVQCEGSGSFLACVFKSKSLPKDMNEPQTVDFNGAKFGKAFEMNRASFSGATNFNALRCGIGAFFHDTKFYLADQQWPVNFVASYFGMACELSRAVFHGAAIFEGLSCGFALNLDLARFMHADLSVSFGSISTPYLLARGSVFRGPVNFASMRCQNLASFDPYMVDTKVPSADALSPGAISPALKTAFEENKIALPENASIEQRDNVWRVTSHSSAGYILQDQNNNVRIVAPTHFERSTDFSHGQFDWILNLNESVFDGPATFNGVRCGGGGFFVNARFTSKDKADFSFGSYGVNLEFVDAKCQGLIDLESCSIRSDLSLAGAKLNSGIELTNASMRRLVIGAAFPLEGQRSVFRGCRFELFAAPTFTSPDRKRSWEALVDSQDPLEFTREIYHLLERYYRSDGQEAEADCIYYAGRMAERKLAGERNSSRVDWPNRKWITDSLSKWLTVYGVHPFSQLLSWILLFLLLGVGVFWSDNALVAVKRQPSANSVAVSEDEALVGPQRGPAEVPTGSPQPATQIQPEGQTQSGITNRIGKVFNRFAYSLDELLPLVNLHIADQWRPSGGWRQAYLAVHILVGWILIPLLIGAFTGMLTKN